MSCLIDPPGSSSTGRTLDRNGDPLESPGPPGRPAGSSTRAGSCSSGRTLDRDGDRLELNRAARPGPRPGPCRARPGRTLDRNGDRLELDRAARPPGRFPDPGGSSSSGRTLDRDGDPLELDRAARPPGPGPRPGPGPAPAAAPSTGTVILWSRPGRPAARAGSSTRAGSCSSGRTLDRDGDPLELARAARPPGPGP
jgi:hypothetical protein